MSSIDDYKRLERDMTDFGQVLDAHQGTFAIQSPVYIGSPGRDVLTCVVTSEAFRELVNAECSRRLERAKGYARAEAEAFMSEEGK
jgi:hypothetical protein